MQVRFVVAQQFGDWSAFWAAGATAGTRDLLDPHRHAVWQHAHHVPTTIFPYLPGAAWLLAPFAGMSLAQGYAAHFVLMILAGIAAALIAARVYGICRELTLALTFAWAPTIASLATGQNALLLLLIALFGAWGIAAESWFVSGLAAGAMLYKPLYAIPFVAVLAFQRNWRALGLAAVCGAVWYAFSAWASAGDWAWPHQYLSAIRGYALADAHGNAAKAISIPQLALRLHVAPLIAYAAGAALFAGVLTVAARMPKVQAFGIAMLAALALGPHTLPYDLTLMIPAIFSFMTRAGEPLRTRTLGALYLVAPLWLLSGVLQFDVLAVLCIAFLALVLRNQRVAGRNTNSLLTLSTAP